MKSSCNCEQCELRGAFLDSFRSDELGLFCDNKFEISYTTGEIVFREGETVRNFSYLKSGLLKLFKTDHAGKDQIITIAGPYDFVSLLGIFSDTVHTYSVSVLEDSVLCCLDIEQMKSIALKNGLFTLSLMEKLSSITNKIILESMDIRRRNIHGKVAYILLKFSKVIYNNHVYDLPVSRREIAEYIGMTTENVIRTLSEFRKEKIIRINGREIDIIDIPALERISSFG